jgi:hypothetical protein
VKRNAHTIQVTLGFLAEVTEEHAAWLVREALAAHPAFDDRFKLREVEPVELSQRYLRRPRVKVTT